MRMFILSALAALALAGNANAQIRSSTAGECELVETRWGGAVQEFVCQNDDAIWDRVAWTLTHNSGRIVGVDIVYQNPTSRHWFVVFRERDD